MTSDLARRPTVETTIRASPQILAPDWRERIRSAPLGARVAFVGLLLFMVLRDPSVAAFAASVLAVVILFAIPAVLARINARIDLYSNTLEYRGPLRGKQRCVRRDIARLLRIRVNTILGPRFGITYTLCLDDAGRVLIAIQNEWWSPSDLERLWSAFGDSVSEGGSSIGRAAANRQYPGSSAFSVRHQIRVVLTVVVVVLAVLMIVGAVTRR
jgi:hypothetical protein